MPGTSVRYQTFHSSKAIAIGRALRIADAHRADLALHDLDAVVAVLAERQELLEVVRAVADVGVQRDVVDLVGEPLQHHAVPADPVRAPARSSTSPTRSA
jgi:hypothetical protein